MVPTNSHCPPDSMMNTLPPSPAASPPLDGYMPRQKDDAIKFLHTSTLHISDPPSPLTSSDRDEPSPPTSRDFTPRVGGDDDGVFKEAPPCSGPALPDVAGADHRPKKGRSNNSGRTSEKRSFPRISRPVELMRNSYDYVVIGSGYGGAVAASRLARSVGPEGRNSVCVLERGSERWPGEYPSNAAEGLKNLHVSGEFAPGETKGTSMEKGDPEGMYRLILGRGLSAVVGSGLGGTSLMNANVFLRAGEETLSMPVWPNEIRNDPRSLDQYYEKVEDVLEPATYPDDYPELPKVSLLERQAEALGMADKFRLAPQTTRFRVGPNACGVEMAPSSLTGEDCTGTNDGSKTTTLVTYLADAWNWGAEMFCGCEVRYVTECTGPEGGYNVFYAWHGRKRGQFGERLMGDLMWVHAKKCVFLGAGSIGTTELLLRSREMGLRVSDRVGVGMSGNGDMLAFGYNTDYEANAIGKAFPNPYNPTGPTINAMIDNRHGHENPLDGYVIEEGAIPSALAPFLQAMLETMPGSKSPKGDSPLEKVRSGMARLGSFVLGPYLQRGALDNTQVYLVMSHDSSQAILSLKDDKPVLEFLGLDRSEHVKRINKVLEDATQKVGGTFVQNPFYALMGEQQVTVHPIGGACMASDNTGKTGVANHMGQVLKGDGAEAHDGLIVMDGALVPAALGVNPFATITALAERNIDLYAQKYGLAIRHEKNDVLDFSKDPTHPYVDSEREHADLVEQTSIGDISAQISNAKASRSPGLGFTEVMSGYIHHNREGAIFSTKREAFERSHRTAKSLCESARFFLSVQAFDTGSLVNRPDHAAVLTGTFSCPTLEGSPFMVQRGTFNLFVVDEHTSSTRHMRYDFDMRGADRSLLHFHGYKVIDSAVALSAKKFWKATSTLYVSITRWPGGVRDRGDPNAWRRGELVARGILEIDASDFRSQLKTFTPTGVSFSRKVWSVGSFVKYFSRKSLRPFLGPLAPLQYPSVTYEGFVNDTPADGSFSVVAEDGVKSRLYMWEPTNDAVPARNVLLIPGAAVDHQIFALPTVPYNLVNYLTRAGYRVFVTVHRIGKLMVAQNDHTTFDARLDMAAALAYIRLHFPDEEVPGNKVYAMSHCMGAVAFSAGILDGTIPASWVSGVSSSQVFMNPVWDPLNMVKAAAGPIPLNVLYTLVAGKWFSLSTGDGDTFVQKVINEMLRFYPAGKSEGCSSTSCHRCSFVFGRCWNHRNLNEATHSQTDRWFGGVNMTLLRLLMRQGQAGHVMNNDFEPLDTPENVRRLRGIPFFLFVGADNEVLSPAATERTYSVLRDAFGSDGRGGWVKREKQENGANGEHESGHKNGEESGETSPTGVAGESGVSTPNGEDEGSKRLDGEIMYRRRVIPGYGHLDTFMGYHSWRDVFPSIREEIDRVVRGPGYRFVEPQDRFSSMVVGGELVV